MVLMDPPLFCHLHALDMYQHTRGFRMNRMLYCYYDTSHVRNRSVHRQQSEPGFHSLEADWSPQMTIFLATINLAHENVILHSFPLQYYPPGPHRK